MTSEYITSIICKTSLHVSIRLLWIVKYVYHFMSKLYTMYKYTICLLSKVSLECTKYIKCINMPLYTEVIHCVWICCIFVYCLFCITSFLNLAYSVQRLILPWLSDPPLTLIVILINNSTAGSQLDITMALKESNDGKLY